ncbi:hypothetical protein D3C78_1630470 [compost metagenome]
MQRSPSALIGAVHLRACVQQGFHTRGIARDDRIHQRRLLRSVRLVVQGRTQCHQQGDPLHILRAAGSALHQFHAGQRIRQPLSRRDECLRAGEIVLAVSLLHGMVDR